MDNKLNERLQQHHYNGSIKEHMRKEHEINVNVNYLKENTTIIGKKNTKQELLYLEALLIKQKNPKINIQSENFTSVLKIFK